MAKNSTCTTPKKPGRRVSEEEITVLLTKHFGNISHVARLLGVDRSTLHLRINKSAKLQQIVMDARERMVDDAESALHAAILQRDGWAVCFTLKTIGRTRGYIEKQEIEHSGTINQIQVVEVVAPQAKPETSGAGKTG